MMISFNERVTQTSQHRVPPTICPFAQSHCAVIRPATSGAAIKSRRLKQLPISTSMLPPSCRLSFSLVMGPAKTG